MLFLIQDGHKPVVQMQPARARQGSSVAVPHQYSLAGQHRLADALAMRQGLVKRRDEAAGGLHQYAMAHRDDGTDTHLQQPRRHRGAGVGFAVRGLAGFQEHQRNAVIAQQRRQSIGMDQFHAPVFQFAAVLRVFKAQSTQPVLRVINTMPVKMQHMEGFFSIVGVFQRQPQCGQGRRVQDFKLGQFA